MIVLAALAALAADPTPHEAPRVPDLEAYVGAASGVQIPVFASPRVASNLGYEVGLESRNGIDLRLRVEGFVGQQALNEPVICSLMQGVPCVRDEVRPLGSLSVPIGGAVRLRPHGRLWLSAGPVLGLASHRVSVLLDGTELHDRTTTHFGGMAEAGYRLRTADHGGLHLGVDVKTTRLSRRSGPVVLDDGTPAALSGWTLVGLRLSGLWFPGRNATRS